MPNSHSCVANISPSSGHSLPVQWQKEWKQPLTIQQTVEVKTLQILSLSHEAIEWSGPAFSQHLHPLHVHLWIAFRKTDFLTGIKDSTPVHAAKLQAKNYYHLNHHHYNYYLIVSYKVYVVYYYRKKYFRTFAIWTAGSVSASAFARSSLFSWTYSSFTSYDASTGTISCTDRGMKKVLTKESLQTFFCLSSTIHVATLPLSG